MRTSTVDPHLGVTKFPRTSNHVGNSRSLSSTRRIKDIVTTQNSSLIIDRKERFRIKDESAWATKDEEKNEISTQLTFLRKLHDQSKDVLSQREQALESLQHELDHLTMMEERTRKGKTNLEGQVEGLEEEVKRIKRLQDKAKDERYVYDHLLDRMKLTKLHLELKASAYTESLKNKKSVLNEQLQRMRNSQEHSFLTKQAYGVVKDVLHRETKDKEGLIVELGKNAKTRREMATRRDERQRRQAEIAEAAANEERDSEEVRLRESYLLHKFWCKALNRKLQREKAQSIEVEEAILRIKAATGLSDVSDIVERYLTREQTYTDLVQAVYDGERKVNLLKRNLEEKKAEIKAFELTGKHMQPMKDPMSALDLELLQEQRDVQATQENLQKHVILYEHVCSWGHRMYETLKAFANPSSPTFPKPTISVPGTENILIPIFQRVKDMVHQLIDPIRAQKDLVLSQVNDQESMKIDQIMARSPVTTKKNLRVKSMFVTEEDGFEDVKDHVSEGEAEAEIELEEQRRKIKQYSHERQESAKKKKMKEKKPEAKKGKVE